MDSNHLHQQSSVANTRLISTLLVAVDVIITVVILTNIKKNIINGCCDECAVAVRVCPAVSATGAC